MGQSPIIEDLVVCIGAQKAGTTWLARLLAEHPEIFVTPVKELHYFDHLQGLSNHLADDRRRSRRRKFWQKLLTQPHRFGHWRPLIPWYGRYMASPIDDDWYRSLFCDRLSRRFAMEATPEYAIIGAAGFSHLKRLAPDVKLIFIMRDPVSRAWSQVLHHCRRQRRDVREMDMAALTALVESPRFLALGDYGQTLADLDASFAPEQTLVLFYEDVHIDRSKALARILAFIGANPDWRPAAPARRFNPSQRAGMPAPLRRHLAARYRPMAEAIRQRFARLPEAWLATFGL